MPQGRVDAIRGKRLESSRMAVANRWPAGEAKRAPCNVQRRPLACNAAVDYFLPAIERFKAAV